MDKRPYPQKAKDRIKATSLLDALQDHALTATEMSATQIRAAEILLKKCLPDWKAVEHSGETVTKVTMDAESAKTLAAAVRGAISED